MVLAVDAQTDPQNWFIRGTVGFWVLVVETGSREGPSRLGAGYHRPD